ncbi:hypothetical protein [Streptomyces albidoflavus]|uniref:hypothetical protein n=1 Tax=Streptomyces albidoflavus TaxID=1886 RepID=UPI001022441A|nr:hypothetical protein [Streptomyces albidoflavus]RZF02881.1 hypothetical protein C0R05_32225 [Streptomyces albidoflavus]
MNEKSSTQPENRRLTRDEIAAAISAPPDDAAAQRASTLTSLATLAKTAEARQAEANRALTNLLSAAQSALPEFGVREAPATTDHQVTQDETDDLYKLLEIVQPVMAGAKEATDAHYSDQFIPLSVRIAVSSLRWGHVKQTATRMGLSRTHFSRIIEKMHPGFLATVAPGNRSKHGYRGARSAAYAGQNDDERGEESRD